MRGKRRTILRSLTAVILAGIVGAAAWVLAGMADVDDLEQLGPYIHYNGILFDSVELYSADVEGALAVGGESKLGTSGQFDFGATAYPGYDHVAMGKYENPNGYPTLLMNGLPQVGRGSTNNVHAYGGPVVLPEGLRDGYAAGNQVQGTTKYAEDEIVDTYFEGAFSETVRITKLIDNGNSAPAIDINTVNQYWVSNIGGLYGGVGQYAAVDIADFGDTGLTASDVAIVTFTGTTVDIFSLMFPSDFFTQYELVILNFPDAVNVSFSYNSMMLDGASFPTSSPNNATMHEYCPRIVWNFPQAKTIQTNACGIVGSVLAPYADVVANGGSINGMLVANSLGTVNGFELHAFYMKNIYDFDKAGVLGRLELTKVDAATGALLRDAEFILFKDGARYPDAATTYVTDRYGYLEIQDLPAGSYRIEESGPPAGYEDQGWSHTFTVDRDNTAIVVEAENTPATVDLPAKKVDGDDNSQELEDARFALYKSHKSSDGALRMELVDGEIVSGQGGAFTLADLTEGFYYLVEYAAPENYVLERYRVIQIQVELDGGGLPQVTNIYDIEIDLGELELGSAHEIEDDQNYAKTPIPLTEGTLILTNTARVETGGVTLVKYDKESRDTLAGAVFELQDRDNGDAVVGTYTTNLFGRIEVTGLPRGNYQFVEITAPEGYALDATPVQFSIPDGPDDYYVLREAENAPLTLTAPITFAKVDATDTSVLLDGAVFQLYRSGRDGDGALVLSSYGDGRYTTASGGRLVLSGLEPGYYYLVEYEPPSGYEKARDKAYQIHVYASGNALAADVYELTILDPDNFDLGSIDSANPQGIVKQPMSPVGGVYEIKNTPINSPGQLTLQKYDGETGAVLAGAEFALEYYTGGGWTPYATLTTSALGYASISDLPAGQYQLYETRAPEGYVLDSTVHNFTIDQANEDSHHVAYRVENQRMSTSFTLKKVNESGGPLDGAVFSLYKSSNHNGKLILNSLGTVTSGLSGEIALTGLTQGYYYLQEIQAPAGYVTNGQIIQVHVAYDSGSLTATAYLLNLETDFDPDNIEAGASVDKTLLTNNTIVNELEQPDTGEIQLTKVDGANAGTTLAGAVFALEKQEGVVWKQIATGITGTDGALIFADLEPGRYRLHELSPPEGYQITAEYYPSADGVDLDFSGTPEYTYSISIPNTAVVKASYSFTKYADDGETLSGAEFLVYESWGAADGEVTLAYVDTVTSDGTGTVTVTGLTEEYYYVAESEAPANYDNDLHVVQIHHEDVQSVNGYLLVVDPGEISVDDITQVESNPDIDKTPIHQGDVVNYRTKLGSLTLLKLDHEGDALAGAEFTLYAMEGQSRGEKIGVYTTSDLGLIEVDGLALGDYLLVETGVPDGFELSGTGEYAFELTDSGYHVSLTAENRQKTVDVELIKVDGGDYSTTLPGARFNLYRSRQVDGGQTLDFDLLKTLTSGSGGEVSLTGLTPGNYYLVEVEAPDGYILENTYTVVQIRVAADLSLEVHELLITDPDLYDLDNPRGILNDQNIPKEPLEQSGGTWLIPNTAEPEIYGSVTLIKRNDAQPAGVMAGVVFHLYRQAEDGDWHRRGEYATDFTGRLSIADLPEGAYKLVEEVPEGYWAKDGTEWSFVIARGGETSHYIEAVNEMIPGGVTVTKVDGDDPDEILAGAAFALYYWGMDEPDDLIDRAPILMGTGTTGPDGTLDFDELPHGWYSLVETEAPAGYAALGDILDGDGQVVGENGYVLFEVTGTALTFRFTVENEAVLADLRLRKIGVDLGNLLGGGNGGTVPLGNVEFALYRVETDSALTHVNTLITDASGQAAEPDLPVGWYVLEEVTNNTPDYDDGSTLHYVYVSPDSGADYYYDIPNFYTQGEGSVTLTLYKVSSETGDPLFGALFDLYRDGDFAEPYLTGIRTDYDGRVTLDGLPEGDYELWEVSPPSGYVSAGDTPITFTVTGSGTDYSLTTEYQAVTYDSDGNPVFTIENDPAQTDKPVVLYKRDRDTEALLAGAVFNLYRSHVDIGQSAPSDPGDYGLYQAGIATGTGGEITLPVLRTGHYYLQEVQAPGGYVIDTDTGSGAGSYFFSVYADSDGELYTVIRGETYYADDPYVLSIYNTKTGTTDPDPGPEPSDDPSPDPEPSDSPSPDPDPSDSPDPDPSPQVSPSPDPSPSPGVSPSPDPGASPSPSPGTGGGSGDDGSPGTGDGFSPLPYLIALAAGITGVLWLLMANRYQGKHVKKRRRGKSK